MLNAMSKIFAAKIPTTEIAGMPLTNKEAAQLLQACFSLKQLLNVQIIRIDELSLIPLFKLRGPLWTMQSQHIKIQTHMSSIILHTQNSCQVWTYAFTDAQASLERKIICINRLSRVSGWEVAAQLSWPIVAETYVWLLPVVTKLQSDLQEALERNELETPKSEPNQEQRGSAVPQTNHARILFAGRVEIQEYRLGEGIGEGDQASYSVKLTDSKKKSMRSFMGRKAKYYAEPRVGKVLDEEDSSMEVVDDRD